MKILCDVCEAAAARLFCAADEAALCLRCDEKVHGCNKLASRHMRLELAESRAVPHCDICENAPAFFFCGIDGASLCLQCDVDVHVGVKKSHERYLLTGQRVEHPTRKLTVKESIAVDIQAVNSDRTQQQQIIHHHHHHHHHHHDDALQAETIIIANSSGERKSSNVVGDKKDHLMLENNQPVSGMIDLNAQPRHLLSQASLPDKGDGEKAPTLTSSDDGVGVVPSLPSTALQVARR
ncbi:unnamed protein product [Sphagnum troendelagicum]|uniref:B box-type domain-containing protein n=1 Tax=Sphagnum troendelagicum TaxID=128251 RepID=A0ABP0UVW2_9BRYO